VNGVTVSSDANGNVTAYNGDSYTWDARGRLVGLSRAGLTASFGYRQDGIRTSKTVNGATTSYLLDGDSVLKETTSGVATDVLQGPGVDAVLKRGSRWLTPDGLGSTATLTDSAGAIQQRYYYQPFGQGMPQPSPGDPQPFQFAGRENDGTGLYYCRARYYQPDWGRFLSEDPAGFSAGVNPYSYCMNNPVNATDPDGRITISDRTKRIVEAVRLSVRLFFAGDDIAQTERVKLPPTQPGVGLPADPARPDFPSGGAPRLPGDTQVRWPPTEPGGAPPSGGGTQSGGTGTPPEGTPPAGTPPEVPGIEGGGGLGNRFRRLLAGLFGEGRSSGSGGGPGAFVTIGVGAGALADGLDATIKYRRHIEAYLDPEGNWW
jgi:RHS repeat-associated protein